MSDQSQGEGWWQASDQRWYPPESRPGAIPPPPVAGPEAGTAPGIPGLLAQAPPGSTPTPAGGRVSRKLAGWLQGVLWVVVALGGLSTALWTAVIPAYRDYFRAPIGSDADELASWVDAEDLAGLTNGLVLLAWVTAFILLVVWLHQAHRATEALGPRERRWSSGWAVGGWFVPLANFVIPALVTSEIERIAASERSGGQVADGWRQRKIAPTTTLFFILLAISIVLRPVAASLSEPSGDLTASSYDGLYLVDAVASLFLAAAALTGMFVVRRITRSLSC